MDELRKQKIESEVKKAFKEHEREQKRLRKEMSRISRKIFQKVGPEYVVLYCFKYLVPQSIIPQMYKEAIQGNKSLCTALILESFSEDGILINAGPRIFVDGPVLKIIYGTTYDAKKNRFIVCATTVGDKKELEAWSESVLRLESLKRFIQENIELMTEKVERKIERAGYLPKERGVVMDSFLKRFLSLVEAHKTLYKLLKSARWHELKICDDDEGLAALGIETWWISGVSPYFLEEHLLTLDSNHPWLSTLQKILLDVKNNEARGSSRKVLTEQFASQYKRLDVSLDIWVERILRRYSS